MLKDKGYADEGSLYKRIEKAASEHVITEGMAAWAHDVRLDANAERHADPDYKLPETPDAQRCIEFVIALGDFMFVLPKRISEGRQAAKAASELSRDKSA
jgi:hypothetical protein